MKAKIFFYGRNILEGVQIAMAESLHDNLNAVSKNKKVFLTALMFLLQINLVFSQDSSGQTLIQQFQPYAVPVYVGFGAVILLVLLFANGHHVIKGVNGDTEAWKKLGGAMIWVVLWFTVTPFVYKFALAKLQGANPLQ